MHHLKLVPPLPALLFLAISVCFEPQVRADTISLFNTGVDSGGTPLAGGSVDPHWSIVAGPSITSPMNALVVTNQSPLGLYAQSSASRWIGVNADGSDVTGVNYTFRMTFDLTGFDPASASISGSWGVDNNGSINLNGSPAIGTGTLSLSGGTENNFDVFHDFSITGGFVPGINTLDFVIEDDGNPGALNVTNVVGTATTAVPEPGTVALFGAGIACLTAHACRRVAMCTR